MKILLYSGIQKFESALKILNLQRNLNVEITRNFLNIEKCITNKCYEVNEQVVFPAPKDQIFLLVEFMELKCCYH